MENQFIFPGTSDEIDDFIENDLNGRECNERKYLYPQYLYYLLLRRKDINIEFKKPNDMKTNNYNYEWTRAFHTLFLQIVTELGEECTHHLYPRITAGKDWEYKYMNHGNIKNNLTYFAIYYSVHTLNTTIPLLTNPAYFSDRDNIRDNSALIFPPMVIYLYRILGYKYYYRRKLFD
jgi:hypothetical protein